MARQPRATSELLSAIDREWQLLIQLAPTLSHDEMQAPDAGGWTPQDNLFREHRQTIERAVGRSSTG